MMLTVYAYILRCLRPTPSDAPITVSEVWAVVRAQFFSSLVSYFGISCIVGFGFIIFFIPGVYLLVGLSLFYAIKVLEDSDFTTSISRSLQLTRGKWWSTFGLLFVMTMMLGMALGVAGGIIGSIVGGLGWVLGLYKDGSSAAGAFAVIASTLGSLFNLFIYTPLLIALAFQYFNLVERHEGVGLRNLVNQLGKAPAAVENAAYRPDEEGEY
ncbi:hypothetical protein IC235_09650 [Hymenobacter sp. BT664]|uniref:Glycerophosphoryl diester phosphodiesterase membrane domain-containing protein n=1 Tax=Hymenobacter montanus TaxID=2771359 RepID=A0A927BDH1_9BACT|nr:hypothetical protein [Hymenobacter montanus]MBD2768154.1 hypothetical protein [Hymenobacter montanus]